MAELKFSLHGDIVTPSDISYSNAIARWSTTAIRRANVVAFPKDKDDVVLAIAYAKSHNLPLAIRGGGHHPAGASSVEDGLVIDLSRYFNRVRIDPENKRAYVGGGAIWETLDKEAIKFGLATVGGTVNHTGVGGLTLGGGYGWLSGEHGMVIDNLLEATVVTASGTVHTASKTVNADLFFGIRGGGCNFGIVTEFVYQLHPQRAKVFAGLLFYPLTEMKFLVSATRKWYKSIGEKEGCVQAFTIGPDGTPVIVITLFYNGSEEEGKAKFKAFYDIPHIPIPDGPHTPIPRERPYDEMNALTNHLVTPGRGFYFKGTVHKSQHYSSISEAFEHLIKTTCPSPHPPLQATVLFEYFPLSKINSVPNGVTAFLRHPTPGVLILVAWEQDSETDNDMSMAMVESARTLSNELCDIIGKTATQDGVTNIQKFGYTNYYAPAAERDIAKVAFGDNYPKLQSVKKRYDPENIFNRWFPITPA